MWLEQRSERIGNETREILGTRSHRGLKAVWSLVFTLGKMWNICKLLNREVMWFDLDFYRITLASVLRMDRGGNKE